MKYLLFLVFSLFLGGIYSQNITVTDIPTISQLPVNAIHRVFQDSEGYMWYGTVNGLCRDDGYHVKVFRSDIETPELLEDNLVECIAEDQAGRIWFGTDKGAYILDKSDYSVRPVDKERLKDVAVMHLYATGDGCMWVGYHAVLAKYDMDGKLVKEYPVRNKAGATSISGFCESREHDILISVWNDCIYRLDKDKDEFVPYPGKMRRRNATQII